MLIITSVIAKIGAFLLRHPFIRSIVSSIAGYLLAVVLMMAMDMVERGARYLLAAWRARRDKQAVIDSTPHPVTATEVIG